MEVSSQTKSTPVVGKVGLATVCVAVAIVCSAKFCAPAKPALSPVGTNLSNPPLPEDHAVDSQRLDSEGLSQFDEKDEDDVHRGIATVSHNARLLATSYEEISQALEAGTADVSLMLAQLRELDQLFTRVQADSVRITGHLLCLMGAEQRNEEKLLNASKQLEFLTGRIRGGLLRAALAVRKSEHSLAGVEKFSRDEDSEFETEDVPGPVEDLEMFVANSILRTSSLALLDFGSYVSERSVFTKSTADIEWAEHLLEGSEQMSSNQSQREQIQLRRAERLEVHGELFATLQTGSDMPSAIKRFQLATETFGRRGQGRRAAASQIYLARLLADHGLYEDALNATQEALSFEESYAAAGPLQVMLHMKIGKLQTSQEVTSALWLLENATGQLADWPDIERERSAMVHMLRGWQRSASVDLSAPNLASVADLVSACAAFGDSARFLLCLLCKVIFPY